MRDMASLCGNYSTIPQVLVFVLPLSARGLFGVFPRADLLREFPYLSGCPGSAAGGARPLGAALAAAQMGAAASLSVPVAAASLPVRLAAARVPVLLAAGPRPWRVAAAALGPGRLVAASGRAAVVVGSREQLNLSLMRKLKSKTPIPSRLRFLDGYSYVPPSRKEFYLREGQTRVCAVNYVLLSFPTCCYFAKISNG